MADKINIQIAYATPEKQAVISLLIESGTSVLQAITQSGITEQFNCIDLDHLNVGVFYKPIDIENYELKEGDRLEIYRPLIIDPKAARMAKANEKRGRKWRAC